MSGLRKLIRENIYILKLSVGVESSDGFYIVIGNKEELDVEINKLRKKARKFEGTLTLPNGDREIFFYSQVLDKNKRLISDTSGNRFKHLWIRKVFRGNQQIAKYIDGSSYRKIHK